jgi:hypothetical protein
MSNLSSYFCICREQALLNARSAPLLSRQRDMDVEKIRYPHVYDSQAEARKTSAFIAGAKVCHWYIIAFENMSILRK